MSDQDLRALLTQLHARLGNTQSLDAEGRKQLTTVLHDIEKVLGQDSTSTAATVPATATPRPRLEALAVKFEADHPQLADITRQLIDLLGKAGI